MAESAARGGRPLDPRRGQSAAFGLGAGRRPAALVVPVRGIGDGGGSAGHVYPCARRERRACVGSGRCSARRGRDCGGPGGSSCRRPRLPDRRPTPAGSFARAGRGDPRRRTGRGLAAITCTSSTTTRRDVTETDSTDGARRRRLGIVESPAKARTIAGDLGPSSGVECSIGHIRDLPSRSADIPAEHKKEPWARLGVDVEHDFEPLYVVNPDKKQQVAKLKAALRDADELLLATDEDREGEAIAWHLMEVLQPRVPVRRMVFHEITPQAIRDAVESPREINRSLVDAQETRRILDRLYGYEVSPVLWKKVMPRLSAGRVQSVATRLLVERERARMRFRSAEYWDLEATLDTGRDRAED